jgi:hypothetical protein
MRYKWRDFTARRRPGEGYWAHAFRNYLAPVLLLIWWIAGSPEIPLRPCELVVSFSRNEDGQDVASGAGSSAHGSDQAEAVSRLLAKLETEGM